MIGVFSNKLGGECWTPALVTGDPELESACIGRPYNNNNIPEISVSSRLSSSHVI